MLAPMTRIAERRMIPSGLVFNTGLDSVRRGIMAVRLFAKKVSAFAAAVAFAICSLLGVATPVA